MPRQPTMQWSWVRYQNGMPSASGDMANNFKNEGHQNLDPGLFTLSPISNTARFLSRAIGTSGTWGDRIARSKCAGSNFGGKTAGCGWRIRDRSHAV